VVWLILWNREDFFQPDRCWSYWNTDTLLHSFCITVSSARYLCRMLSRILHRVVRATSSSVCGQGWTHSEDIRRLCIRYTDDLAMAQVVSRRPLTTEARVRARVNSCVICGGQSGTGTGFSPSSSVFPCRYHSTVALQTHIIWGMRNMLT
jgi:hypothetical protein